MGIIVKKENGIELRKCWKTNIPRLTSQNLFIVINSGIFVFLSLVIFFNVIFFRPLIVMGLTKRHILHTPYTYYTYHTHTSLKDTYQPKVHFKAFGGRTHTTLKDTYQPKVHFKAFGRRNPTPPKPKATETQRHRNPKPPKP